MSTVITEERADTPDAIALVEELDAHLIPQYPPASHHGYDVEKLLRQGVAFFVLRHEGEPAGCGGIQLYGTEYGELKRMYVRPAYRGQGFAKRLLDHLSAYALSQGVTVLRLETGIYQTEAIGLYERWGFERIPPFGEYLEDPLSLFFEKPLG